MKLTKNFLTLAGVILAFGRAAFGANGDGCFQMYATGSLFPVICVAGSMEEGIGGRGVRVALIGPNSTRVNWCAKSTSMSIGTGELSLNQNTYFFSQSTGMLSVHFDGEISADKEEGSITLEEVKETTTLKYVKLRNSDAKKLGNVFGSQKCQEALN